MEIPKADFEHEFEAREAREEREAGHGSRRGGACATSSRATRSVVKAKTKKDFPQDPLAQLRGARDAVFRSWQNPRAKEYRRIYEIPDHIGTAVNVQAMVFGNTGDRSATGVGFTRNPGHGREGVLRRIPGERAGRGRGRRHPHAASRSTSSSR